MHRISITGRLSRPGSFSGKGIANAAFTYPLFSHVMVYSLFYCFLLCLASLFLSASSCFTPLVSLLLCFSLSWYGKWRLQTQLALEACRQSYEQGRVLGMHSTMHAGVVLMILNNIKNTTNFKRARVGITLPPVWRVGTICMPFVPQPLGSSPYLT